MVTQSLPPLYDAYVREQRRLTRGAVAEVRRQWRRMDDDFDRSWSTVGPSILTVTGATQKRLVENAGEAVPEVLEIASRGRVPAAAGTVNSSSFIGVAGDGRPAAGLMRGAVVQAKSSVGAGLAVRDALLSGLAWLTMATSTLLADTARAAEVVGAASRLVTSYVRVVQPGACSRCAILAGQTYKAETPFLRHPGCLCEHMPVHGMDYSEIVDQGYMVSPQDYFESLSEAEQNRIFTNAGAEAIRNGADPIQVVNARRGMYSAQGQLLTAEGTTARGLYGRSSGGNVRLMPETIRDIARSPEHYRDLLTEYGYLRPSVPQFTYSPSGQLVRI